VQYLGAASLVKVDWAAAARRFEGMFYTTRTDSVTGVKTSSAPTVPGVWSRLVHFLTVDFQQRASFVAGLALGLRIG
jgi:FUN14 domain-containing protein 1